jgi:hypothetical protein
MSWISSSRIAIWSNWARIFIAATFFFAVTSMSIRGQAEDGVSIDYSDPNEYQKSPSGEGEGFFAPPIEFLQPHELRDEFPLQ